MAEQQRTSCAWRWVFDSLRAAVEPASLVPHLLSHSPALLQSISRIPPREVSGDISLLVQTVSATWLPVVGAESARTCRLTCNLINEISFRMQLEFSSYALLTLVNFFQGVITSATPVIVLEGEGGTDASKAKVEALTALGQVLHDNGDQLPVAEVSLLVSFLLGLINHPATALRGQHNGSGLRPSIAAWSRNFDDDMEVQRLAFVAIGNLFTRAGPVISNDTWRFTVQELRTVLERFASKGPLTEGSDASRYFSAFLRCIHLVLSDRKGSLEEHVAAYVGFLRMFFLYGLSSSQGQTSETRPWKEASAYRPPHLRGKIKSLASTSSGSTGMVNESSSRESLFDSDQSDSDGSVSDNDRYKSSRCRITAISTIQVLARADPKSLHAHWALLLPTHDVLQPRPYQATLLTTMLFDPIVKTRVVAAATVSVMLEGPVRAFLQVAEYRQLAQKAPFTTLSGTLGQIVIQLHTGLVHVVSNEKHSGTLVAALKALSLLVTSAPYNRLPLQLLPNVVLSVTKKTQELFNSSLDQSNTMTAAVTCLSAALSATPASSGMISILTAKDPKEMGDSVAPHSLLMDLVSYSRPPAPAVVRVEAFQALKAAVHNYPMVVHSFWDQIYEIVAEVVDTGWERVHSSPASPAKGVLSAGYAQPSRICDDKLVQSAIKLLDETLRVLSGFEVPDELHDDSSLKASAVIVGLKSLTLASNSRESVQLDDGCLQWLQALDRLLPGVLVHSAPMVRGAALTCFAGLTPAVFAALPVQKLEFIVSSVMRATRDDDTPAVRSAACRAVGVIVGFPQVSKSKEKVIPIISLLLSRMEDNSAAVRITASWAVANLCDALCTIVETDDATDANYPLEDVPLASLAECTFKAANDGDKVRANVVRALGNLARFVDFSAESSGRNDFMGLVHKNIVYPLTSQAPASQWLGTMVQTFVSCVTTGNVKVQWNVCHALGNLFLNRSIHLSSAPWALSVFSILLLLLRGSANFKIRMHAASALAVPNSREDYGLAFRDVVQTLVQSLDSLENDSGAGPTSMKYQAALSDQITHTTIHVLALGQPQDYDILKDTLPKRANFLHNWLSAVMFSMKRGLSCSNDLSEEAAFGMTSKAVSTVEHDEKPLPPPRDQRGYRHIESQEFSGGSDSKLSIRLADAQRAVKVLSSMYMYGGGFATAQNFQNLL
ncbi:hypothetical protein M758_1G307300 [Ceratodon purpureus]|uniref:DUF4042 domain-containing protein n=1 Tax=Ceratodon purpureus TaxID=3225 RepID=A0A8T0JE03_CERPU|nr:hypothetical protein KC19_1G314200 [Ceratodon purpureus]KAG0632140.1 hypothetical protein M758_1G307300 [Ceratodon purpureus]